jgi:hypothetical protein
VGRCEGILNATVGNDCGLIDVEGVSNSVSQVPNPPRSRCLASASPDWVSRAASSNYFHADAGPAPAGPFVSCGWDSALSLTG